MRKEDLPVPEPCHADWAQMSGDARRRFCGACQKHVHHLSEMTRDEAARLIAREDALCVRYELQPNGEVRFQPEALGVSERKLRRRRTFGAMMAGLALTLPAGCGTAEAGASATVSESNLLEEAAEALSEWLFGPEEGCELTETPELEPRLRVMGGIRAPSPDERMDSGLDVAPEVEADNDKETEDDNEADNETEADETEPKTERITEKQLRTLGIISSSATMGVLIRDHPNARPLEEVFRELDEVSTPPKPEAR